MIHRTIVIDEGVLRHVLSGPLSLATAGEIRSALKALGLPETLGAEVDGPGEPETPRQSEERRMLQAAIDIKEELEVKFADSSDRYNVLDMADKLLRWRVGR